jgi:hypothetical protein
MTRFVIKHLNTHLEVAFVEEVYQAVDLDIVDAGKLLSASMEVHLASPVEQDLHETSCLQGHLAGSLPTRNSANLFGSFFLPKGLSLMRMMRTTSSKYLLWGHFLSSSLGD